MWGPPIGWQWGAHGGRMAVPRWEDGCGEFVRGEQWRPSGMREAVETPKCESGCGDPWARGWPWGPPSGKAAVGSPSKQGGEISSQISFLKNQCNLFQEDLYPTSSSVCHPESPCSTGTQGLKAMWS